MCISKRRIKNPHDGRFYWVKCGRCDACLQERANRHYARINKEQLLSVNGSAKLKCFFVTPTYENEYIPFIRHSELLNFLELASNKYSRPSLNIYRNAFSPKVIDTLHKIDFENRKIKEKFDFLKYIKLSQNMPYLRNSVFFNHYTHLKDCVGVIYQRDIQLFFKRLKINLVRAGYEGYFSYFYTSELGGNYKRPHFHLLIYFDEGFESLVHAAIVKSWSYADLSKPRQRDGKWRTAIELAINPAAYVSEYINLRTIIPPIFADAQCFKPSQRFSNGFGTHFKYFSASKISELFDKGTLSYPCQKTRDGVLTTEMVRLPRYSLIRYFPKFKGFNELLRSEIYSILREPNRFNEFAQKCDISPFSEEANKVITFINSRRRCYFKSLGISPYTFAYDNALIHYCYIGSRIWQLYASESIKHSYDNVLTNRDLFEHFDNIQEFYEAGLVHGILVENFEGDTPLITNPNEFFSNRAEHSKLKSRFDSSIKVHSVKSLYYEHLGYE